MLLSLRSLMKDISENYEDAEEFSRNVPQGTACMIAELKSPLI